MYATASTHLPHPIGTVTDHVLAGSQRSTWLPELQRTDARPWDELGATSTLSLGLPGWPEAIGLTTTRVVRSTVTASGRTPDGRSVALCLSLSPWHGGTAVVLSVDADGGQRPLRSWALSRRLELALVRLAGELAAVPASVGPACP